MRFKDKYIQFKGTVLHVSGEYTPWTDEDESTLKFDRIGRSITYSMGVGHFDDYSQMFFECPELLEQLTDWVMPLIESIFEENEKGE